LENFKYVWLALLHSEKSRLKDPSVAADALHADNADALFLTGWHRLMLETEESRIHHIVRHLRGGPVEFQSKTTSAMSPKRLLSASIAANPLSAARTVYP